MGTWDMLLPSSFRYVKPRTENVGILQLDKMGVHYVVMCTRIRTHHTSY